MRSMDIFSFFLQTCSLRFLQNLTHVLNQCRTPFPRTWLIMVSTFSSSRVFCVATNFQDRNTKRKYVCFHLFTVWSIQNVAIVSFFFAKRFKILPNAFGGPFWVRKPVVDCRVSSVKIGLNWRLYKCGTRNHGCIATTRR